MWDLSWACVNTISTTIEVTFILCLLDNTLCYIGKSRDIFITPLPTEYFDRILSGLTATISAILEIDETRICSCSYDITVRVWNSQNGKTSQKYGIVRMNITVRENYPEV